MNKFTKFLGYCGCVAGALSVFLFVLLPAVFYGIFPQYGKAFDQFMTNLVMNTHFQTFIDDISPFIGPFFTLFLLFLVVGVPLIAFSPLWLNHFRDKRKIARLKVAGIKGKAKILAIQDTGITVNQSPYVTLTMEIEGLHSKVEMSSYVSRVDLPRIGDTIEIVYDPANPQIMMPANRVTI